MSNGIYDQKWGQDLAARISEQIKSEVGRIRMDPPLIPIVPGKSRYEDVVQSFEVIPGPPIGIKPSAKLTPVTISIEFSLAQQQFGEESLAARLALRPASDLAFAEDAIILHGASAKKIFKSRGLPINEHGTLGEQIGLFRAAPTELARDRSIVDSILDAIQALQTAQQHGPYCVVVSPDLHREAMTPIPGTGTALIAPILPQLRADGFRFSETAPPRTGVVFSLGGAAVDLPIPYDMHVEFLKMEDYAMFVVVEQFRLRINDSRAVVTLS